MLPKNSNGQQATWNLFEGVPLQKENSTNTIHDKVKVRVCFWTEEKNTNVISIIAKLSFGAKFLCALITFNYGNDALKSTAFLQEDVWDLTHS